MPSHRRHQPKNRHGRDDDQNSESDDRQCQQPVDGAFRDQQFLGDDEAGDHAKATGISPMLEPTPESPNPNPERTLSRQPRRKRCLSGVRRVPDRSRPLPT